MLEEEDQLAPQTLVDNGMITLNVQRTPKAVLDAIQIRIKEEDHFSHYKDENVLNVCQKRDQPMHTLSNHIIVLVTNCKLFE